MTVTKLKWAAGMLAACGMLTFGGVWVAGQGPGTGPAAKPAAADTPPPVKAERVERRASGEQRMRSLNNLKHIMLAVHNYHDVHLRMPADFRDKDGKPLLSWRVALLPYLEQDDLYKQFKLDEPWDSEHNKKLLAQMPEFYRLGGERPNATDTYYQMFTGPGAAFVPGKKQVFTDITDGTSRTLGVVEAGPPVPWTKPADLPFDAKKPLPAFVTPFSNGWHVTTLDGAAYALRREIDEKVLRALITAAEGDNPPELQALRAALPVETDEDRAELKKLADRNRELIDEVDRLMKEHVQLLGLMNRVNRDLLRVEDDGARLKEMIEGLKGRNKKLRDELGLRPGPVPREE